MRIEKSEFKIRYYKPETKEHIDVQKSAHIIHTDFDEIKLTAHYEKGKWIISDYTTSAKVCSYSKPLEACVRDALRQINSIGLVQYIKAQTAHLNGREAVNIY